jgi:hypothetical protein
LVVLFARFGFVLGGIHKVFPFLVTDLTKASRRL